MSVFEAETRVRMEAMEARMQDYETIIAALMARVDKTESTLCAFSDASTAMCPADGRRSLNTASEASSQRDDEVLEVLQKIYEKL